MVIAFNLINLGGINIGASPTVAINRQAGPQSADAAASRELHIPFQDLNSSTDILSLLSWQTAISDFAGRQEEMAALTKWAESEPRTSVKFVVGEGGIGKTRLAAEFGLALREKGWDAGMIRLESAQTFAFPKPAVLLIIDYPEEQLAQAKALLAGLARLEAELTIRVLFLTRQPMESWVEVVSECRANTICDFEPILLKPVDAPAAHLLYNSALERASQIQDTTPPAAVRGSSRALAHYGARERPNSLHRGNGSLWRPPPGSRGCHV